MIVEQKTQSSIYNILKEPANCHERTISIAQSISDHRKHMHLDPIAMLYTKTTTQQRE